MLPRALHLTTLWPDGQRGLRVDAATTRHDLINTQTMTLILEWPNLPTDALAHRSPDPPITNDRLARMAST